MLYRLLYREAKEARFHDTEDLLACDECIARMKSLLAVNPNREFQILDDHGVVVVSTLSSNARMQGAPAAARSAG